MNSELKKCVSSCRNALIAVGLLTAGVNILSLTGSIFMLALYDRVIPSGSIPTLVAIGLIALGLYVMFGAMDIIRQRILTRLGFVVKEAFGARIYDVIVRNSASGNHGAGGTVADMDQVQGYLSSLGPTALFDLPWVPFYLAICFMFHPVIGWTVAGGAAFLLVLAAISNHMTRESSLDLNTWMTKRAMFLSASQSQAETIQALGMTLAMSSRWNQFDDQIISTSRKISDTTVSLGTVSRTTRLVLQSLVLAVGGYLVIMQDATGGVMIAGSILGARALAPIELAIGHWKNLVAARQSWKRIDELLTKNPSERQPFATPAPSQTLVCQNISVSAPNVRRLLVRDVYFNLKAGEALGVIGATGSGKSTLARALVGLSEPVIGGIYLDGQPMSRWTNFDRGRFIGYLPQNVALFEGTIAQNIARFDPEANADDVVRVAKQAGVHALISRFPDGYDTVIGQGGNISGGQAQRIGLARALYGDPFIVVLDEPNSNLDGQGEAALQQAIESVKDRGGIVVLISHRLTILHTVDQILVMQDGTVKQMGPRAEVFDTLTGAQVSSIANARKSAPTLRAPGGAES